MNENETKVLALYDFASKQAYIYKTSKIKEISGASALLGGMYEKFVYVLDQNGIHLKYEVEDDGNNKDAKFSLEGFDQNTSIDGEVLYDGGGNLMVLWKSFEIYKKANQILSVYLLKNAPGVSLIASCVEYSGVFDDRKEKDGSITKGDRTRLYEENSRRKSRFPAYDLPEVFPLTQVDPMTFLPVTYKRNARTRDSVYPAADCSLSSDLYYKAKEYQNAFHDREDALDKLDEGMLAVIYIDGNSMGKKLIAVKSDDYDIGVKNLRNFSRQVNDNFVVEPVRKIKEAGYVFRQVIGGGDEITLICKAEDALNIMELYFSVLQEKMIKIGEESFDCTSGAGISVFHAKSPFNVAYDIAEACCEFAKKKAHKNDGNYFCFYYCHSGITNVFDVLHKNEQEHASGKPYAFIGNAEEVDVDCYSDSDIRALQKKLIAAGRANVKALGSAAQESSIRYQYEVKRVNGYLKDKEDRFDGSEDEMRIVYDMAEFYDLWFAKEE